MTTQAPEKREWMIENQPTGFTQVEEIDGPRTNGKIKVISADYCEHLESQLTEQCKLNAMGQERELKLMTQLATERKEHGLNIKSYNDLNRRFEEMNKNCISLNLHESRMANMDRQLAEATEKHKQAMKDWSFDSIRKTEIIVSLEKQVQGLEAAINRVRQSIAIGSWNINPEIVAFSKQVNDLFEEALQKYRGENGI